MSHSYLGLSVATVSLGFVTSAMAEWRCDCTTIVDSCTAEVAIEQDWIAVSTDRLQCARVDYFIDGLPFIAVVVEGQQRQDWITRSENPSVLVQSCQVCRDNSGQSTAQAATTDQASSAKLQPLIEVPPEYPAAAQTQGLEGYLALNFNVDEYGTVSDAEVSASEPGVIFDQAALTAVGRWRYPAAAGRAVQAMSIRLEFNLSDYVWQLNPNRVTENDQEAQTPVGRPRNQCVREQTVYNYGEIVEVGLINACEDPLLVFACAESTGQYQGRWVCSDSEQSAHVLLKLADERVGSTVSVETPDGTRDYRFAENFFVSRAPNTRYWWLACHQADIRCRSAARQWRRSLDRQVVSANPQARTPLPVARSY